MEPLCSWSKHFHAIIKIRKQTSRGKESARKTNEKQENKPSDACISRALVWLWKPLLNIQNQYQKTQTQTQTRFLFYFPNIRDIIYNNLVLTNHITEKRASNIHSCFSFKLESWPCERSSQSHVNCENRNHVSVAANPSNPLEETIAKGAWMLNRGRKKEMYL